MKSLPTAAILTVFLFLLTFETCELVDVIRHYTMDGTDDGTSQIYLNNGARYVYSSDLRRKVLQMRASYYRRPMVKRFEIDRTSFSVVVYFKLRAFDRTQTIVGDFTNQWQFLFRILSSNRLMVNLRRDIQTSGSNPAQDLLSLTASDKGDVKANPRRNGWQVAVLTYDHKAGIAKLYLNGEFAGVGKARYPDHDLRRNNHALYELGSKGDTRNEFFQGQFGGLTVYGNVLTSHCIKYLPELPESSVEIPPAGSRIVSWSHGTVKYECLPNYFNFYDDDTCTCPSNGGIRCLQIIRHYEMDGTDKGASQIYLNNGAKYVLSPDLGRHVLEMSASYSRRPMIKRFEIGRTSFSVVVYFKLRAFDRTQTIVGDFTNQWQFLFRILSSNRLMVNLRRDIQTSGSNPAQDLLSLTADVEGDVKANPRRNGWQVAVLTYDHKAGIAKLYLNGEFAGVGKARYPDHDLRRNNHPLYELGSKGDTRNEFFQGQFGGLAIYQGVISACDVSNLPDMPSY